MLIAKKGEEAQRFLISAGTVQAVCFAVFDLGLQDTGFKSEEGDPVIQHKIKVGFEVNETIPEGKYQGKRATIYKDYTLSLSEKANLRKDLESWRGQAFTDKELEGFDVEKLVGTNAMLSIIHKDSKGKTYANIATVGKLMKGLIPMKPENDRKTPEWVEKIQARALEPVQSDVEDLTENVRSKIQDSTQDAEEVTDQENQEPTLPF